jgi:hypothetical protein
MDLKVEEGEDGLEGGELRELVLSDLVDVDGMGEASKRNSETVRVVGQSGDDVVDAGFEIAGLDSTIDGGSNLCDYVS